MNENSAEIYDDHLLMIEVKYALCLMYGNIIGFRYQGLKWSFLKNFFLLTNFLLDLNEKLLMRKIQLCTLVD